MYASALDLLFIYSSSWLSDLSISPRFDLNRELSILLDPSFSSAEIFYFSSNLPFMFKLDFYFLSASKPSKRYQIRGFDSVEIARWVLSRFRSFRTVLR